MCECEYRGQNLQTVPIRTLEDESTDWSRGHVLDETREEGLSLEVGVVLLQVLFGSVNELDVGDLVA